MERFFGEELFHTTLEAYTAPPTPAQVATREEEAAQERERLAQREEIDHDPPDLAQRMQEAVRGISPIDLVSPFDESDLEELRDQITTKRDQNDR